MSVGRAAPVLALLVALTASPAPALTLDDLAGRWRGEGALSLNDEPAQRLRCQIRFRTLDASRSVFSGRCATAQAAQSFTYMLILGQDGTVRAENRAEPQEEGVPMIMQGTLATDGLRFAEGTARFDLSLTREGLDFRLEGDGPQGFARGQALLQRTGDAQ